MNWKKMLDDLEDFYFGLKAKQALEEGEFIDFELANKKILKNMDKKDFETSSGSVFADLGASNPEERLAKAKLAMQINILIKEKGLSQKAAAELLGIDQPKISALYKGKLAGFSLERLFRFLNILGQDRV